MVEEPMHPVNIPRREKDFQGMLEYKKEDELKLIKNLILGKSRLDWARNHVLGWFPAIASVSRW